MAKVALASDHAGFRLKEEVKGWLSTLGHEAVDLGPTSDARVDYPDFAHRLAAAVQSGDVDTAILVCGSGIGMAMAANRHRGVRAANCTCEYQAEMARRHNDANVLCLGERVVGPGLAESMVKIFLATPFDGGRHADRVHKIDDVAP